LEIPEYNSFDFLEYFDNFQSNSRSMLSSWLPSRAIKYQKPLETLASTIVL